jgi:hypothetical protein
MPVGELFFVELEMFQRSFPLAPVPGVGEKHTADIPEDRADL